MKYFYELLFIADTEDRKSNSDKKVVFCYIAQDEALTEEKLSEVAGKVMDDEADRFILGMNYSCSYMEIYEDEYLDVMHSR